MKLIHSKTLTPYFSRSLIRTVTTGSISTTFNRKESDSLLMEFGPSFTFLYASTWFSGGIASYTCIKTIGPNFANTWLKYTQLDHYVDFSRFGTPIGDVALAILINELLEPVRLSITLLGVRPLKQFLQKRNLLSSPAPSTPDGGQPTPKDDSKGSLWSRWKAKAKTYGPFFLVYYTGFWMFTGVSIYFMIEQSGPSFAIDTIKKLGLDQYVDLNRIDPSIGNIAVAVAINELIEPIRLPIALLTVAPVYRLYKKVTR